MPGDDAIHPVVGEEDRPFWEAAGRHEFRVQKCGSCDETWWPPGSVCPACWSEDCSWVPLSGDGVVNSWAVFHRPYFDEFEANIPYNVIEVELVEGPRYIANLVDCDNDDISRGMKVEVVFDDLDDGIALPKFRPKQE